MSAINSFSKSGFWDYKNIIVPTVVTLPLALNSISLLKNIYQNPKTVKEKALQFKSRIVKSFTTQPGETLRRGAIRIFKNILVTLLCAGLMGGAAFASISLLPASLSISVAISSIFLIGKLFFNAKNYKKRILEAFRPRADEVPSEAKKRITKNIIKTILIATATIALIAISTYVLYPLLTKGFSWSVHLPFQTKGVVFAEYAGIGAIHGALGYSKYKNGNKSGALFHLFAGALSFAFPTFYLNHDMRLHHSFYGLAMMALPSKTAKFLGSLITFDSSLYMLEPVRGFPNIYNTISGYDFINSIVDKFPLFINTYVPALIVENINKNIAKK